MAKEKETKDLFVFKNIYFSSNNFKKFLDYIQTELSKNIDVESNVGVYTGILPNNGLNIDKVVNLQHNFDSYNDGSLIRVYKGKLLQNKITELYDDISSMMHSFDFKEEMIGQRIELKSKEELNFELEYILKVDKSTDSLPRITVSTKGHTRKFVNIAHEIYALAYNLKD